MVSIDKVTIRFAGVDLFSEISFMINPHDRIGLVGKNGAGKSTLLKILAGLQQVDSGTVVIPSDVNVGYLPQQMIYYDGRTVFEEAINAFADILAIEEDIKHMNEELIHRTDYESAQYLAIIDKLTHQDERYRLLGGPTIHAEVEKVLLGLGFEPADFKRDTTEFSGGWRMRIELAKVLLRKPNLLLLDEPTNHLDI
jgi:ATP-binding cassette, subfamily F, member 3